MKQVYINFENNITLNTLVLVDGKKVAPSKNEAKNNFYHYQTDKDTVNVKILSYTEMSSKWWYFISLSVCLAFLM